ncbi:MAG TPA: M28 family metallopeptidase [Kofleriaceae bacterium]|nr:M28 family metallopeptidase [Kofleriaceae bacterium]
MRALAIVLCAACSAAPPGPGIDVDRAMAHVAALVQIGPRPGDSARSAAAADYITAQLAILHVVPERFAVGGVDLPAIELLGAVQRPARHVETVDPDLLVRFGPERGKALLVMAHYDTVPPSPGAVDNGCAVAVLLELARVLHDHPPAQPVILAFTANEEIGLVGSEALAARRADDVAFAIALDLIGGSGPLVINGASTLIGVSELRWLADAADRAGVALTAPPAHRVISRWWPQAERSDHGPFTRRGVPAVHFYDRGQDGERIDLAYHSSRDTLARVDRASLDEVGRLLRALVAVAPPRHAGDGFWLPVANVAIPRWPVFAVELALAVIALAALLATALRATRERGGAGLCAGLACYAVATAAASGVERFAAGAHPAPWLHGPLRAELAEAAIVLGGFVLATRLVARRWPWIGGTRYLVASAIPLVAIGGFWLATDALELAWVWLVPACAIALAPRLGRAGAIAVVAPLLPAALVLAPAQLREAAWNGFLPTAVPLAAWLAALLAPTVAAGVWWTRRRPRRGPLGTLVINLGCALAVASGVAVVVLSPPACSASKFQSFHLACEQVETWP